MRRSERDVAAPRERRAPALDALRPVHRAPDGEEVADALAALSALLVLFGTRSQKPLELPHEHLVLPCHRREAAPRCRFARQSATRTKRVARCVLAGFSDAEPDLLLAERSPELEVADDARPVHEEGAREAEDAEATGRLAVAVEDWDQPVEAELVEERADLVAGLLQIDFQDHDIGFRRGDALQRGHLLPARLAPGRPKVHDDDLAPVVGQPEGLASRRDVLEVRRGRRDSSAHPWGIDLGADDADVWVRDSRLVERQHRP